MTRTTTVAVALLVLVATAGTATAQIQRPLGVPAGDVGPSGGLPEQVPDFVSGILDAVGAFLGDLLDAVLGGAPTDRAADGGSVPTATPTATDGAGSGGDETTATPVERPFAVTIDGVSSCGTTCRDVTVSLTNQQGEPASDVTVATRVYAGNSTAAADLVWRGSEDVGALAAGETHPTTRRVDLSLAEAYDVKRADGWVTVETTIRTDERTVTFTERRNVG
jgi:hypothetical protein